MRCECGEHEATIHEVVIRNGVKRERHLCERCAMALGYDPDGAGSSVESLLEQLGPILPLLNTGASTDTPEPDLSGSGPSVTGSSVSGQSGSGQTASGKTGGHGTPAGSASSGGSSSAGTPSSGMAKACPGCGIAFADFRRSGLLGCPRCYDAFEAGLSPVIERAQQRGSRHLGKVPRRALERSRANQQVSALLGDHADRQARLETLRHQLAEAIRREDYERAARVRDELQSLCVQDELDADATSTSKATAQSSKADPSSSPSDGGPA